MNTRSDPHFRFCSFILVIAALAGCDLPRPVAPSWDVDLNIPLLSKKYILSELAKDFDELKVDSLGILNLTVESPLDTVFGWDRLTLPDRAQEIVHTLGNFTVPMSISREVAVSFADIFPAATDLDGAMTAVPPFNFEKRGIVLQPLENIAWADIVDGYVDVTIFNDLPAQLGKPVELLFRDARADSDVIKVIFPNFIPSRKSRTQRISLQGRRLGSELTVSIVGGSPGTSNPVLVQASDVFRVAVELEDVVVSAAAADLNPIQIADTSLHQVSDSLVISRARFREGTLRIELDGDLPVATQVIITLLDFTRATGEVLTRDVILPQIGMRELAVDLSGWEFSPLPGEFGAQNLRIGWQLTTLNAPGERLVLHASDRVNAQVRLEKVHFSEISGRFRSREFRFPPQVVAIDIPGGLDSLGLQEARAKIELFSRFQMPLRARLELMAMNDAGNTAAMTLVAAIPAAGRSAPARTSILLTKQNSPLINLLNLLPTALHITGVIDVGDDAQSGTLRESDNAGGHLSITAPLAFDLPEQTIETEIVGIDIWEEARKRLRSDATAGFIQAAVSSHIPVGTALRLQFASRDSAVFTDPSLVFGPFEIAAGRLDPVSGTVDQAVATNLQISLTKSQLDFFSRPQIFGGLLLHFPGTNQQVVKVRGSDFMDVQSLLTITATISNDN